MCSTGAVGVILILIAIAPVTPLANAWRLATIAASGSCQPGEEQAVARLGHESMRMRFGDPRLPLRDELLGTPPEKFGQDPAAKSAWWKDQFVLPARGEEMIYVVPRNAEKLVRIIPAYNGGVLEAASTDVVSLCLAAPRTASRLGDFELLEVVRMAQ